MNWSDQEALKTLSQRGKPGPAPGSRPHLGDIRDLHHFHPDLLGDGRVRAGQRCSRMVI
jgi:hypothetical protein